MSIEDHELDEWPEDKLTDLFRRALSPESSDFVRPSENAIRSYIAGEASEAEQAAVHTALAGSSEFRAEVLAALQGSDAVEDEAEIPPDKLREWMTLATEGGPEISDPPAKSIVKEPRSGIAELLERLQVFFWRAGPAYAIVALLLTVQVATMTRIARGPETELDSLIVAAESIDVRTLEPVTRGADLRLPEVRVSSAPDTRILDIYLLVPQASEPAVGYAITVKRDGDVLATVPNTSRIVQRNGEDYLHLLLAAQLLSPGEYRLEVQPLSSPESPIGDPFGTRLIVERSR